MRLTCHLLKQPIIYRYKLKWKALKRRRIPPYHLPPIFEEKGIQIYDAKDVVRSDHDIKRQSPPQLTLPEPFKPNPFLTKGPEHPHWKEAAVYHYKRDCKLFEGNNQICALTKTIQYEGLPLALQQLEGAVALTNQDELVQDHIMHALVWDGIQIKLPKKLDITRPGYNFPREFGIPVSRKVWNLQQSLINLSNMATGKYGSWKRTTLTKADSHVFCEKGGDRIMFTMESDSTILTDKPLPPAGKKEKTLDEKLPDIFPLKPTIDIPKTNIYVDEEVYPIATSFHNVYIHTVYISHNTIYYWHQPQKLTRAIAACFSFAIAQAHQLYGTKVKELPVPITIQGVYMDLNTVGFLVYQLNTLNLDSDEGIKNQVWVDGPHQFFKECNQDQGVIEYEPSIIRKLFTLNVNGLM